MKRLWSSFAGFRKVIASALKEAGAPKELYEEVGYTDCEGDGIAGDLFESYEICEDHLKCFGKKKYEHYDLQDFYDDCLGQIEECVLNVASSYRNVWNYPPGYRPKPIDSSKLANDVGNIVEKKINKLLESKEN
jgi:hypothetical protein